MNFQDRLTSVHIRQFHRNPAVKPARTQQSRIQGFRTVGSRQDDDALTAVKAVHFGQQLVQGLLPFIVAAEGTAVTLFTDGINFVDKDDTGSLFLGFLKQVTDTGRAHADEHFNKLGTGDAEEGHPGFPGDSLGQQRLTGAGRANQQRALRHGSADGGILAGIVQEVHQFHQCFLGFVLSGHVRKSDSGLGLHVHLGIALAEVAHAAKTLAAHKAHDQLANDKEEQDRQDPVIEYAFQRSAFLGDDLRKGHLAFHQLFHQLIVVYPTGDINLFILRVFGRGCDPLVADLHLAELALVHHLDKGIVGQIGHLGLEHGREHPGVQSHEHHHGQDVVIVKRPSAIVIVVVIIHKSISPRSCSTVFHTIFS